MLSYIFFCVFYIYSVNRLFRAYQSLSSRIKKVWKHRNIMLCQQHQLFKIFTLSFLDYNPRLRQTYFDTGLFFNKMLLTQTWYTFEFNYWIKFLALNIYLLDSHIILSKLRYDEFQLFSVSDFGLAHTTTTCIHAAELKFISDSVW